MIRSILVLLIFIMAQLANLHGQTPANDNITNALPLPGINAYCSTNAFFSNAGATPSGYTKANAWITEGNDIWYTFTAVATDISITVTGRTIDNGNTLNNPLVAIYTYQNNVLTEQIGSMLINGNITSAYKGGITIGQQYYVRISAENNQTGTFKLCANNYNPPHKPGQDYSSAALLCSKSTFTEQKVSGAGLNNRESIGSCLNVESNTAWYTWIAANNGNLGFTITPTTTTDDIDWVLYDLGPASSRQLPSAQYIMRCASGSGVNCSPRYFITGANSTSIDLNEQSGCVAGQDGFVKSIDMVAGHTYALLIDNFSSGANGFTLAFDGTGEFLGPSAEIQQQQINACEANQRFNFTATASNYNQLIWNFGEGASIQNANTAGPHEITYASPGKKTVTLEAISDRGCNVIKSLTFDVNLKPATPVIQQNRSALCIGDVLELTTNEVPGATYSWTGPNNFTANVANLSLAMQSVTQAGDYTLKIKVGDCESEAATATVTAVVDVPIASFNTDVQLPGKFLAPVTIHFNNQSQYADRYEWDFGDGQFSNEPNPAHQYVKPGKYTVQLKSFSNIGCLDTATVSDIVILDANIVQIPNSFSPNGDGINDKFNINLSSIAQYQIKIFNRYGDQIFLSNDLFDSWDGSWNGKTVPVGAYFYRITGFDLAGKALKYSGSITLIR